MLSGEQEENAEKRILDWIQYVFTNIDSRRERLERIRHRVACDLVARFKPKSISHKVADKGSISFSSLETRCWIEMKEQYSRLIEITALIIQDSKTESFEVASENHISPAVLLASKDRLDLWGKCLGLLCTFVTTVQSLIQTVMTKSKRSLDEIYAENIETTVAAFLSGEVDGLAQSYETVLEEITSLLQRDEIQNMEFITKFMSHITPNLIEEEIPNGVLFGGSREKLCWERYAELYRHLDVQTIISMGMRHR
jgi:hypothetical protein